MDLSKLRNIGISAHIDSGKTTLSERILFYTGRIHKIEEVKGGGDGATMDFMDLEKERGITITSAATSVKWPGWRKNWDAHPINLIDTPGHVDFTVEVERSLRVLDGAVLVLCAVGGVQSQSMTVDRQMKRYQVPRIAFINKMDRTGAAPFRVTKDVRDKLGADAVLMQYPMGAGETFVGMCDLVNMKAYYFDGNDGETVREEEIPAEYQAECEKYRHTMLEHLAMYSDELMELLLSEQEVSEELIHKVCRVATQTSGFTPVLVGSAYKNKGVQLLLDAVIRYLPSPLDREIKAKKWEDPNQVKAEVTQFIPLYPDPTKPFVGMAFKIVDDQYGQLTFMRIYQGRIEKGQSYVNQRTTRSERFSRIVKMHADKREEIDFADAGDIVAVIGVDCASGDSYAATQKYCTLESMFIPEPVIKVSVTPSSRADSDKMSKALQRFRKEDPTFRVFTDEETNEILIAGMGELHLEIYVERIKREYKVELEVGAPKVSYREAPTRAAAYDYKHKKQTGGSGQFAHIKGSIEPLPEDSPDTFVFEENVTGGRIPKNFIPSVEKGVRESLIKGPVAEYPVVQTKFILDDGSYHEVDSSDRAFQTAGRDCFRETFRETKPCLLEPIMKVEIECPENFQGAVTGDATSRRGIITASEVQNRVAVLIAEVPLSETFGYSTDLRSMTQGQGTFTMELLCYRKTPTSIQEEIVAEKKKEKLLVGSK